jgi:hypothetical protein
MAIQMVVRFGDWMGHWDSKVVCWTLLSKLLEKKVLEKKLLEKKVLARWMTGLVSTQRMGD